MSDEFTLPPQARELLASVRAAEQLAELAKEDATAALDYARKTIGQMQAQLAQEHARRQGELDTDRAEVAKRQAALDALVRDRLDGFEFIARAWADYELALSESQAGALIVKRPPAKKAADTVREKGRQVAEARRRAKLAEWIVALYEFHFPWLPELRDLEEERAYVAADDEVGEERRDDPVAHWLSKEEWQALSTVERNQRALDRYLRSRKSNWQIGRDYERYIGYLREKAGCRVTYHGIIKGFEDLGRDLIAERGSGIEVIQCKRWSREKLIHEKHVFQLFGTMVAHRIEHPGRAVRGTFVTSTRLSDRALAFARELDIAVEQEVPLDDYPRIKCNVARESAERIYHLPFDQAYDATVIEPERGEFYATTVAEAEAAGFRRAFRWRGAAEAASS